MRTLIPSPISFSDIAPLFKSVFSEFQDIAYKGASEEHVLSFTARAQDKAMEVRAAMVMHRREDLLWTSCLELLQHSRAIAQAELQGGFIWEVLSWPCAEGLNIFQPAELAQVLINTGRRLLPGQSMLVKYIDLYALLTKTAESPFGKMQLITHTILLDDEKRRLDLLAKKMLAMPVKEAEVRIVIHDISREPILPLMEEAHREKLKAALNAPANVSVRFCILDKDGAKMISPQERSC